MDFWKTIKKRHSTRAFLNKEIKEEKIKKILEAANLSPSAHNLQSYKIYLIKNKETKKELVGASLYNQKFIGQAPIVLVFVSCPKKGNGKTEFFSLQDATIACYQAWLAAVNLGLSGVWVGAFDEGKIAKILGLEKFQKPIAILPIGYAGEIPKKTKRKPLQELVMEINSF